MTGKFEAACRKLFEDELEAVCSEAAPLLVLLLFEVDISLNALFMWLFSILSVTLPIPTRVLEST